MTEIYNPVENPEHWQRFCADMAALAREEARRQDLIADKWWELGEAHRKLEESKESPEDAREVGASDLLVGSEEFKEMQRKALERIRGKIT